ncbi:MAG: site-specific DNA-methyltransferase [Candidatus Roizmanbacteria bacterium]|nr:site-specific DNA-methyltransferase [Candidatus Roizmanbacteria bacterium]
MSRKKDFEKIKDAVSASVELSTSNALLVKGDSLNLLKSLPNHCVSLILTDPPYHATKKENIYGDTLFKEDRHYIEWMTEYATEWRRVLKPHGSLFCFCAPVMAARLEIVFSKYFNILSQIVWTKPNDPGFDGWKQKMKKEALRQWYAHTERLIFAEPAHDGNLHRSYFGNLLYKMRKQVGMTMHQLTESIGAYGRVNHGGAVSNWEAGRNIPSPDQYNKLYKALLETGRIESIPPYQDAIRPFKVNGSIEFTDVWNFPSVRPYKGKHPAEKPLEMLEHAIKATTYPGDIVLDCFSGSGNTGLAALNSDRLVVLMEIDPIWVSRSASLLEYKTGKERSSSVRVAATPVNRKNIPQLPLFLESK